MGKTKGIYFPGLNGIRAFAALVVVFVHTSNRLDMFGLKSLWSEDSARFAVTVFFALSGFLITYLLLVEKEKSGTIDIKKFYYRRILRIWPLYYTYILISVIVADFNVDWPILFYLLIIPNLRSLFQSIVPTVLQNSVLQRMIGHYWSLGVEEQFYAFWPFIVKKVKKLFVVLLAIPIVFLFLKVALRILHAPEGLVTVFNYTRFGCMAIGALGAYFYYYKKNQISFLFNRGLEVLVYLFFCFVFTNNFHITSIVDHEILAIFTILLIYQQIGNPKVLISLEHKLLDFLGKISFGIYVYHPLIIYVLSLLLSKIVFANAALHMAVIFISVLFCTILISYISYEYFEKRFLKLKHKYTTVESVATKADYNGKN